LYEFFLEASMTETKVRVERTAVVLHTRPALEMNEEQFFEFCQLNKVWRIERSAEGDLEVMVPTGFETSDRKSEINMQLRLWAKQDGSGIASDSSGGFILPNGAMRSPDASWIPRERLAGHTPEEQRFLPLCPDFVIELRSPSDPLAPVEAKMREYIENGARLGWLIDSEERKVHVHRPNNRVEISDKPDNVSGDPILPSFVLDLKPIWKPGL
jgi:Uma2 family endonuclease